MDGLSMGASVGAVDKKTAAPSAALDQARLERLVRLLSAATFLIFFQAYMVAPLIPRLSTIFGVSAQTVGLIVPAYLIPYGISTLVYGVLSDRLGRRRIMLASLTAFVVLTGLTAGARSVSELLTTRLLTGLGASGVVPLGLALIGQVYPYERRGRPLGWLFGAMAGGAAFGSTFGALLEPWLGWRGIFLAVSALGVVMVGLLLPYQGLLGEAPPTPTATTRKVMRGYRALLATARGLRTYTYVLLNSVFHSGVFTWLGLYFAQRHGLGEVGIGLALLGYGVPGFVLGPIIGRAADRWGRRWLIPIGLGLGGLAAGLLIFDMPVLAVAVLVTLLSLGYDMTQPLLAGIVTALGGPRAGQAMGLNVFCLFTGFGLGSLLFGAALTRGFSMAFAIFSAVQLAAALAAIPLFRSETAPTRARP
jgi:predicted MFS family arabinose efflux permease